MKLSVIMPVFNERKTIREIIAKVMAVPIDKELVIVDDASTDGTRDILKEYEGKEGIKVYYHNINKGKEGAIKTGIPYTTGEIISIQDGDLETDPNDFIALTEPIKKGEAEVVYGSRYLNKREKSLYFAYKFGARFLSHVVNILYGQNITDEATCYKVFKADVLKKIPLVYDRFEFCPEVTAKVSKMGYKIKELPMNYYPRSFEEGKKMNWRDGLKALWVLVKYRVVS
ncbi:MAG TPA: glycosyltransferase family 2 protein [Chitinophagales bacterium]|nr:glycosyltransferase family 2 protein [Chitinophagales bacterium]